MHSKAKLYFRLFLALLLTMPAISIHAEGSRDLYPNGIGGGRAVLYSGVNPSINMPFPTRGVHYVYAKPGETIALASSAQFLGSSTEQRIRLYGPDGNEIALTINSGSQYYGNISGRNAEIAGPRLPGQGTGENRYRPIYHEVQIEGIYRVEFDATRSRDESDNIQNGRADSGLMANSTWTQKTNSNYIWAWDVSVANTSNTGWINGRVYTNVVNMDNNQQTFTWASSSNPNGFYGNVKVLTRDGYVYNVNNNGQNGLVFTFMVNNRGFHVVGNPDTPSYSSVPGSSLTNPNHAYNRYSDPREEDEGSVVTHKIFYNLPNSDLPETSTKNGKAHWLRVPEKDLNVNELKVVGVEGGTDNQLGNKGAYIEFYNESGGDYYITISPKPNSEVDFPVRQLSGPSAIGENKIFWDGKDGEGDPLPSGISGVNVELKLRGAEVHFPYIDVEQNAFGIIIELLTMDLQGVRSDRVFWNDEAIDRSVNGAKASPINASHDVFPDGTSSSENGHKWAGNSTSTSGTWGDERGIDTWTFIEGDAITVDFDVDVKIADLMISHIGHDKGNNPVVQGEIIEYTVTIRNGLSGADNSDIEGAPFTFTPPDGFIPEGPAVFEISSCGSEATTIAYNETTKRYESVLNLDNDCEVTYTFPMKISDLANAGSNRAEATILRPRDVHDPDATNTSNPGNPLAPADQDPFNLNFDDYFFPPTNPYFEDMHNGMGGGSNNIANIDVALSMNYWHGTISNEWADEENWTAKFVPGEGADVIFATDDNNGDDGDGNGLGTAINDLYLDDEDQSGSGGRIIGNLINNSTVDLVITSGNQLIINGVVEDDNDEAGTIVIKSDPANLADPDAQQPSGTLIFAQPENNQNVEATVEFYNQAYDCETCGFYTRSWQYFGVPVRSASFPYTDVLSGNATVNLWTEPFNGDKWRPLQPTTTPLEAFKGYQITNSQQNQPTGVYSFKGVLFVDVEASVPVTRTTTPVVNYPGVNLIGNSFTAAIPITRDALKFPSGIEETVYLFNTGTRDEWRKLDGTAINQNGYRSGQYLAVPIDVAEHTNINLPTTIPSMHAFMVLATSGNGGDLKIMYSELGKNTKVNSGNGDYIVTRSTKSGSNSTSKSSIPSLVMDVIGEQSADRVWIFAKEGTTYGFDNGWDGRKMLESGIAQLYVAGDTSEDRFQVATVPGLDNVTLGFVADADAKYTIEFALSDHWTSEEIYLNDLASGTQTRVINGGSYTFEAKKGDSGSRFQLSYSGNGIPAEDEAAKIRVNVTEDNDIAISNNSNRDCTVFVSDTAGKLLRRLEVQAGNEQVVENISRGAYVVRLQNVVVNDVRKVLVK